MIVIVGSTLVRLINGSLYLNVPGTFNCVFLKLYKSGEASFNDIEDNSVIIGFN